jgi:hypothetical protein
VDELFELVKPGLKGDIGRLDEPFRENGPILASWIGRLYEMISTHRGLVAAAFETRLGSGTERKILILHTSSA